MSELPPMKPWPEPLFIWVVRRPRADSFGDSYIGVAENAEKVREWVILQGRTKGESAEFWQSATIAKIGLADEGVARGLWMSGYCTG